MRIGNEDRCGFSFRADIQRQQFSGFQQIVENEGRKQGDAQTF